MTLQNASLSLEGAGIAPDLPATTYTHAFTRALLIHAEADRRIVAITAAMPGPTGLLPFEARFPDRFVDVGHGLVQGADVPHKVVETRTDAGGAYLLPRLIGLGSPDERSTGAIGGQSQVL